jgi:D-alanyl-D-alanine carboxypeptidase
MRAGIIKVVTVGLIAASTALSAAPLDEAHVARIVRAELTKLGVPSASVAIVLDDRIAYAQAFGKARLTPQRAATKADRYQIGSISKEFLAASMLMLQEEGRLSLEDRVGQYLPELDSAANVALRQLLSHTAGIRDFWPQDYVFTRMLSPISHAEILDLWARQPLDFPPGERWQYSNTGYTLAGVIFEKVAGESLFAFLQRRVFSPLHMSSDVNADEGTVDSSDTVGYTRAALGPLRPAPYVGKGWLFAAGELGMTAEDLARWDLSLIDESLMKPASYRALEREILLGNGAGSTRSAWMSDCGPSGESSGTTGELPVSSATSSTPTSAPPSSC